MLAAVVLLVGAGVGLRRPKPDSVPVTSKPELLPTEDVADTFGDSRVAPTSVTELWDVDRSTVAVADPPPVPVLEPVDDRPAAESPLNAAAPQETPTADPPAAPSRTMLALQALASQRRLPEPVASGEDRLGAAEPAAASNAVADDVQQANSSDALRKIYAGWLAAAATPQEKSFEASVRELLDKPWTAGRPGLKLAELSVANASKANGDDPRLPFAYGLVLLKNYQYDEALKQFEASSKMASPTYLPGARATVWLRCLRGDANSAMLGAAALAKHMKELDAEKLPDAARREFVAWLGRFMGFLEGPGKSRDVELQRDRIEAEIRATLGEADVAVYKLAKAEVLDSYAERLGTRDQTRDTVKKGQEKKAKDDLARIDDEKAKLAEDQQQMNRTAAQWDEWLRQQLTTYDSQLAALELEYNRVDAQARTLVFNLNAVNQEVENLVALRNQAQAAEREAATPKSPSPANDDSKTGGTNKTAKSTPPTTTQSPGRSSFFYQSLIDQGSNERFLLQREYAVLDTQAATIKNRAATVVQNRQTAINRYQTASGKLHKENQSLTTRFKVLGRQQLEAVKPAKGNSPQVRAQTRDTASLKSYVDFSLDLERQRLLDSLARP